MFDIGPLLSQCPCCARHTLTSEYDKTYNTIMDYCSSCEFFKESRLELLSV